MNEYISKVRFSAAETTIPGGNPLPEGDSPVDDVVFDEMTNSILVLYEAFGLFQKHAFRDEGLRDSHLTRSQLYLMLVLLQRPLLNMTQLARSIAVSKEQASRAVSSLVDLGYVERMESPNNRRLVLVQLTERGRAMLEEEPRGVKLCLRRHFQQLCPEDRQRMNQAVGTLLDCMNKMNFTTPITGAAVAE